MAAEVKRFLGFNERLRGKSTEKLSTGYRINRAADDAAGLTISEKMRGQIRGLHQASDNIQDGISLIQTAEGALQETHSILQRMRELSVQAANDTYVEDDRKAIQAEMDQLTEEVDRIAEHTEFNNGIYPLLGAGDLKSQMMKYLKEITVTVTVPGSISYGGITYQKGDSVTVTGVYVQDYINPNSQGCLFIRGKAFGNMTDKKLFKDSIESNMEMQAKNNPGSDFGSDMTIAGFGVDEEGRLYSMEYGYKTYYYSAVRSDGSMSIGRWPSDLNDPNIVKVNVTNTKGTRSQLWIQAGANANQGIDISLVDGTAAGLGLTGVSVLSATAAGNAIQTVDGAISQVSRYRSDFGAQQNRLEHAMAVDDNTAENLQAAESRIRDTDMGDEIVENAKLTIMEQAMQAMLANANRQSEGILALLQG